VPQCPFPIEYSTRLLDDIRLAVVDAFFSLPRGGAEIGGILLGKYEKGRLQILDSVPVPCEHASGPSFILSPKDHTGLAELLANARGNPRNAQPVGWYHSHTRSEIFLSETDLEIHKRYFPEPWQVALVFKPHTFQPVRAGFFFREADGYIQESASYHEIVLDPMGARPPVAEPPVTATTTTSNSTSTPTATPPEALAPTPESPKPAPIRPASPPPPALRRKPVWPFYVLGTLLILGGLAFLTRDTWLPPMQAFLTRTPDVLYVGLNTLDSNGQLQIRWDHNSPAVRQARDAILSIDDGGQVPESIELDPMHLKAGSFTYGRRSPRVDVTMTLILPDGGKVQEATSFLGQATPSQLQQQIDQLKRDLEKERARTAAPLPPPAAPKRPKNVRPR